MDFRPDLQGLRALAIVLVVLGHAGLSFVPGGFIGVDVFFVLSGYLITGLLWRELERDGRIVYSRFYARRLKRLLPALVTMLCISSGLAVWLLSSAESKAQLASGAFAATWTSNLYFVFTSVAYFNELAGRDLFLHTWSLGVEEQFYLVWPLVMLALVRFGGARLEDGNRGRRLLFWGLLATLLASLAASIHWSYVMPQSAFYQMPSRIWQFALGALLHLSLRGETSAAPGPGVRLGGYPASVVLSMGLALILGSAVGLDPNRAYPGLWALVPSLGAVLVIAAGHGLAESGRSPLAHPALVWLGDRSYSLYLWHWPVLMLGFSLGFDGQSGPIAGLVLLSILAAMLSYRLVELPFWKGRFSHHAPRQVLLAGGGLMACVVLTLTFALTHLPETQRPTDRSLQALLDVPTIYRMDCDTWYADADVRPCIFGDKSAAKTVVLLGDSIGVQWFSAVADAFPEPEWRLVVLTKSSCPLVDEDFFYGRIGQVYHVCTRWRNGVLDELDRLKPDVVVLGSSPTYSFSERSWVEGSARILARVSKAAGDVYVIPGTPSLPFDGPGCADRSVSPDGDVDPSACLAEDRLQRVEPVAGYLGQAAGRFANVRLLDLNDLVCPGGACNAIGPNGELVFRDSQHLTDSFVRSVARAVRQRLLRLHGE
jgi:peptidoglycan/LPS O-acetylase OafA/YrhL